MSPNDLPVLSETPKHHPDCCLSISTVLIQLLAQTFRQNTRSGSLVLSIGSGSGLLEALLMSHISTTNKSESCRLTLECIEVQPTSLASASLINKYLSEDSYDTVKGTWELSFRARYAVGLMFVYPRNPDLVMRYLKSFARDDAPLRTVVWLGPKNDWALFEKCFEGIDGFGNAEIVDGCGLVDYEMMAVLRRQEEKVSR